MTAADAAFARSDYKTAVKEYAKASDEDKSCELCTKMLAISYAKLGDEKNSRKIADRLIAMATTPAQIAAAHVVKAETIILTAGPDRKKVLQAEPELRTALQQDPNSATAHMDLGITLIKGGRDAEGVQELQTYLKLEPNSANPKVKTWIERPRSLRDPIAPEFAFHDISGTTLDLAALRGKVVVLDFWATWCGPCRKSVPELKDFRAKYSPDDVVLISVSGDQDEKKWREFIADKKMDWPQHWDHDGSAAKAFAVNAFPTYLIIDQEGFIATRIDGLDERLSVSGRLKDDLKGLLKPKAQ